MKFLNLGLNVGPANVTEFLKIKLNCPHFGGHGFWKNKLVYSAFAYKTLRKPLKTVAFSRWISTQIEAASRT